MTNFMTILRIKLILIMKTFKITCFILPSTTRSSYKITQMKMEIENLSTVQVLQMSLL